MDNHRIILAISLLFVVSCGVTKPQVPPSTDTHVKDSIVWNYKDSTVINYVSVDVPVPVEVLREIVPAQDSSHLETSVAVSDAYIDTLGFLHHSLENKKTSLETTVPVQEHFHEEVGHSDHQESHQETITETVEVEKPLTWWQRFRLGAFWWLIGLALVGWRRELLALAKAIIKLF